MLDLFCGRGGWTDAFLARGWEVVGVDIVRHPDYKGEFLHRDVMELDAEFVRGFDFACASSPCEEFSVHGMKHFHPNPKFPDMGLVLFCWTRRQLELSGIPFVMENVRATQQFVGIARHHCGPFYLWGNAVPPLMPQGIIKGWEHKYIDKHGRKRGGGPGRYEWSTSQGRRDATARVATIPPELSGCVADYAERVTQLEIAV